MMIVMSITMMMDDDSDVYNYDNDDDSDVYNYDDDALSNEMVSRNTLYIVYCRH